MLSIEECNIKTSFVLSHEPTLANIAILLDNISIILHLINSNSQNNSSQLAIDLNKAIHASSQLMITHVEI